MIALAIGESGNRNARLFFVLAPESRIELPSSESSLHWSSETSRNRAPVNSNNWSTAPNGGVKVSQACQNALSSGLPNSLARDGGGVGGLRMSMGLTLILRSLTN
jgi:hypothetical protein